MTRKELLLSAINLQKTDRLPVITLTSGVWLCQQYGLSLQDLLDQNPEKSADYIINHFKKINTDLIWTAADCNNIVLRAIGAKTNFNGVGQASTVERPLIEKPSDVDKIVIDNIYKDKGINALVETTKILHKRVGQEYLIGISQWGPFTLSGLLMGIENFMKLIIRDRQGARYILAFSQELIIKYWHLFIEAGAQLVCMAEPSASGDMISSTVFNKLALPYINSSFKNIEGASKMLHICGNTTKILDPITKSGAQLFSMDYKVDLKYAKEKLSAKLAFAGQIDPVNVMLRGSISDVKIAAEECINSVANQNGYILMPGCDIPPKTSIDKVLAMVEVAHKH